MSIGGRTRRGPTRVPRDGSLEQTRPSVPRVSPGATVGHSDRASGPTRGRPSPPGPPRRSSEETEPTPPPRLN